MTSGEGEEPSVAMEESGAEAQGAATSVPVNSEEVSQAEAASSAASSKEGQKAKTSTEAENKDSGIPDDIKNAVLDKISNLQDTKAEDEKVLARLYKKASKDLKEQLDSLGDNSAEKIKMLQQKLLEKIHECNKLDRSREGQKRLLENSQREKEAALAELTRSNTMRKKLEALCKELQKQNKSVLEESKLVAEQEQDRRRELSERLSESIKDVQNRMAVQDTERLKQAEENDKLREQLKSFLNQYEVREKHFEHQLHAKDLECQLANAKLKQSEELCSQAIRQAEAYKQKAEELAVQEHTQRTQLMSYGDKFKEFQETLTKSNEVFATFKKESEKSQKRLKGLEKERKEAVTRAEKAEKLCEQALENAEAARKELAATKKQKERMEGLCRTLTVERQKLKEKLGQADASDQQELAEPQKEDDAQGSGIPPVEGQPEVPVS